MKRVKGENASTVIKGHYLNRMIRDHNLPAVNSHKIPCLVATYRDFRDILCSHARRGGSAGIKSCLECDASTLESSKAVVMMTGKLFSKNGGQAGEVMNLENRGALLIRYEDYVGCAESLINTYATWLGADLAKSPPSSSNSVQKETYMEWKERVVQDTSITSNSKRADTLKIFNRYNPDTGIHGGHISNKGRVGGWKECMTSSVKDRVMTQLGPYLSHFNYTTT
mmetsp:Transcript_29335/g.37835  ORF Transcript_29335/g.37835 Transcript_29335/m.37835 type:complete len:225 (+) Transcript_29335:131-805(+)